MWLKSNLNWWSRRCWFPSSRRSWRKWRRSSSDSTSGEWPWFNQILWTTYTCTCPKLALQPEAQWPCQWPKMSWKSFKNVINASSELLALTKNKNKMSVIVLGMATFKELHLSDTICSAARWTRRNFNSFLTMGLGLEYSVMDPFTVKLDKCFCLKDIWYSFS